MKDFLHVIINNIVFKAPRLKYYRYITYISCISENCTDYIEVRHKKVATYYFFKHFWNVSNEDDWFIVKVREIVLIGNAAHWSVLLKILDSFLKRNIEEFSKIETNFRVYCLKIAASDHLIDYSKAKIGFPNFKTLHIMERLGDKVEQRLEEVCCV